MAISFVNKGTFASGNTSTAPGIPAGLNAGDFMVLVVETEGATIAAPSPAWTQVTGSPQSRGGTNAAGGIRLAVYTRFWQAGDTAPTVVTTGANHAVSMIFGFRGVDPTTPLDGVTPTTTSAAAATTLTMPGITTATNNAVVVHCMALDADNTNPNFVTGNPTNTRTQTCNGAVASGATTILLNAIANVAVGMTITGSASIPANTRVTAIAANTITLSAATTGTIASGATLTFTGLIFTGLGTNGELHDQVVNTQSGGGIFVAAGQKAFAGATGDTTAAQGSSAYLGITLSLRPLPGAAAANLTLDRLTVSGTATSPRNASANQTLRPFISSGTATVVGATGFNANASLTLDPLVVTGTAEVVSAAGVNANASLTLDPFVVTGSAQNALRAQAALTLAPLALTASAQNAVRAQADLSFGALTLSGQASGLVSTNASASLVLDPFRLTASAQALVAAQAAVTLSPFSLTASAQNLVRAQAALTLGALTLSGQASGQVSVNASASLVLAPLQVAASASALVQAQGAAVLDPLTLSATGAVAIKADLSVTLGPLVADASAVVGSLLRTASLNATLGSLTLVAEADGRRASAGTDAGPTPKRKKKLVFQAGTAAEAKEAAEKAFGKNKPPKLDDLISALEAAEKPKTAPKARFKRAVAALPNAEQQRLLQEAEEREEEDVIALLLAS